MRRTIILMLSISVGSSVRADMIDLSPDQLRGAPYIVVGEVLRVDTRSGEYVTRVKG